MGILTTPDPQTEPVALLVDEPARRAWTLANGMTVVALSHDAAPLVSVRVYARAGSALEGSFAGSGISHLLEHVGTGGDAGDRTEREILEACDSIGGLVNAYTCDDHICYHATASSDDLETAVDLMANWAIRPALAQAVFDRELGVVHRELERDRDDPEVRLEEAIHALVYRGHPLQYPIIGHPECLSRLRREDLATYHARTHAAENLLVVVAGDVGPDAVLRAVLASFAGLARRSGGMSTPPPPVRLSAPRRLADTMDVGASSLCLAWQTVTEAHDASAALDLLAAILAEGNTARLVKRLRWDLGLVHDICGSHESTWHTKGMFRITAQIDRERLDEVERAILDEIERLEREPVSDDELNRARRQIITPLEKQRQTAEGLASQVGEDFLATGSLDATDAYIARINQVTSNDVSRTALNHLQPNRRAVATIVTPDTANVTTAPPARSPRRETERFELPNGLVCLGREMRTSRFVAITLALPGGLRTETAETGGLTNLMCELLPRGTQSRSPEAIAEFFESLGSPIRTGPGFDSVHLECIVPSDAFHETMTVLADIARSPAFDGAEIDKVRPAIRSAIARINDEWHGELNRFARSRFFGLRPYGRSLLGTIANIERFQSTDLTALHGRQIRPRGAVVSIAGPVSTEKIREECERVFGSMTGDCPAFPEISPPRTDRDVLFVKQSRDDREAAGLFVGFPAPPIRDPRHAALAVMGTMLAGYALSGGRLFDALRGGDQDLVYEVSGGTLSGDLPGFYAVTAACDPDDVNEVCSVIRREISAVCAGSYSDAELDRARTMVLTGELDQLQTPGDYARRSAADELAGLGFDAWRSFQTDVAKVDRKQLLEYASAFMRRATIAVVTPAPDSLNLGIDAEPATR